ncbi:MAG: hypothetical protein HY730_09155 [Candidatus Tectomicrobia bacterium]|uniref:Uncharacterized protein n=1 Tax=Tectimicrobiota bacterium TaxID=2528274 RepID=A0A933LRN5_UNCTE|nr:hypothetical protein [Candidatus Tectomicrobia bacterium]
MKHAVLKTIGICSATLFLTSSIYAAPASDPGAQQRMTSQQNMVAQAGQSGQATTLDGKVAKKGTKKATKKGKKSGKKPGKSAGKKRISKPKASAGQ